jgi:transposase-like protein
MTEGRQMRKSRFSESQIVQAFKQEGGRQVKDVCRKLGVSEVTYYSWKSKYGGMEASDCGGRVDYDRADEDNGAPTNHGYTV